MTRKDYIRIARALRTTYTSACESGQSADAIEGILRTAYSVASELADDNPRFNGHHFMDVVRSVKSLDSRPPRGDSRRLIQGRPTPVDLIAECGPEMANIYLAKRGRAALKAVRQ